MKLTFESTDLATLSEELLNGMDDLEVQMKPFLMRMGNKIADDMVNAMLAGKDLGGAPLKPNEPSTYRRKKFQKEKARKGVISTEPLIETGELTNRALWKVSVRKTKKGVISVSAVPSKNRRKVFYGYIKYHGYNRSQGMTKAVAELGTEGTAKTIMDVMARWLT